MVVEGRDALAPCHLTYTPNMFARVVKAELFFCQIGVEREYSQLGNPAMNATKASYIENQFGPSSELVDVARFVQTTPQVLPPVQHPPEIAEQCR